MKTNKTTCFVVFFTLGRGFVGFSFGFVGFSVSWPGGQPGARASQGPRAGKTNKTRKTNKIRFTLHVGTYVMKLLIELLNPHRRFGISVMKFRTCMQKKTSQLAKTYTKI